MAQPPSLLERLAAHRTLSTVPHDQLAWLANAGVERTIEAGEILTPSTGPVRGLYVVLDGHLSIRVDRGSGPRMVMEWRGGDVTGILPYSRIKAPPGNVVAEERTQIVAVEAALLPRMIHECHELTAVLVHVMVDRARVFKSSELLDEKMASLGRLAAGLAHELNNPASAVARSAKTLTGELAALEQATRRFCALNLSDDQRATVANLRDERTDAGAAIGPLERSDRQDALDAWLVTHHVAGVDTESLAEAGLRPDRLEGLSALVGPEQLGTVLAYVAAGRSVRQLAEEIETSATRIHSLVAAVKGFTYVNQQATLQPIAIGRGLADTITVLRFKAKSKAVEVHLHVADNLPAVEGYGGELNQVWANLLDNAIDAAPGGHVRIDAAASDRRVIVRVIDDGPGIPADVVNRIFDPFFTTKDVGQGTGLGLDIARRIVQRHRGAIDVSTGAGGTEFRVTLPASPSAVDSPAHSESHS
jgi:signal transduction histidine kinase